MSTSTITHEQEQAIADYFAGRHIPVGLGSEDEACSVGGINLALGRGLTDALPAEMSHVIGRWMIPVQDAMPDALRNSLEWRRLLPLAAGTGQARELDRYAMIKEWLCEQVLTMLQPLADAGGYGSAWAAMCHERSVPAANAAQAAAISDELSVYCEADEEDEEIDDEDELDEDDDE